MTKGHDGGRANKCKKLSATLISPLVTCGDSPLVRGGLWIVVLLAMKSKISCQPLKRYRRHGRRVAGVEENTACQGQRRQQQIGNPQQDGQQIPQQLATR